MATLARLRLIPLVALVKTIRATIKKIPIMIPAMLLMTFNCVKTETTKSNSIKAIVIKYEYSLFKHPTSKILSVLPLKL